MTYGAAMVASDNQSYMPVSIGVVLATVAAATPRPTPKIKLNPAIGLATLPSFEHVRPGLGGAWRAWIFARALDNAGSGCVSRQDLRRYFAELGANTRTFDYWIDQAVIYGLFREGKSTRDGKTIYYLTCEEKTAELCGCDHTTISKHYVWIPADVLLDKNTWKGFIFTAWRSQLKRVSQKTTQKITGIHPRTQRRYLRGSKAKSIHNVVRYKTKTTDDQVNGLRDIEANPEDGDRVYYEDCKGNLAKRLPDGVTAPEEIELHDHIGRNRKVQKGLKRAQMNDLEACDDKARARKVKVFCETSKELKATQRVQSRIPASQRSSELYIRASKTADLENWGVIANV